MVVCCGSDCAVGDLVSLPFSFLRFENKIANRCLVYELEEELPFTNMESWIVDILKCTPPTH